MWPDGALIFSSNSPIELTLTKVSFPVSAVPSDQWGYILQLIQFSFSATFFNLIVMLVVFNIHMGHLSCLFTLKIEFMVSSPSSWFSYMNITWCNLVLNNWESSFIISHHILLVWSLIIVLVPSLTRENVNIFLNFSYDLPTVMQHNSINASTKLF